MARKGAIQMSLGLIVAVVFAVVLLTLAITWIQGLLGDITGITEDLTEQAEIKLMETFSKSTANFAVWPPDWDVSPGNGLRFKAGIKNTIPDSSIHRYVINIEPAAASQSRCPSRDIMTCNSPVPGKNMYDFMEGWTTIDTSLTTIPSQQPATKIITIEVPPETGLGFYLFNVVACYDKDGATPSSVACLSDSPNIVSAAEPMTIKVE